MNEQVIVGLGLTKGATEKTSTTVALGAALALAKASPGGLQVYDGGPWTQDRFVLLDDEALRERVGKSDT